MDPIPPLRLTGAEILRDGAFRCEPLALDGERIVDAPLPGVDITGYLILPGIVDLHGGAFEHHIAPHPPETFPIAAGLLNTERDAAAHGVTTAYLAQSWSWEGGLRGPEFAEALMDELAARRADALIDLRLQIQLETHMTESRDRLISAITRHGIDLVVFNNHLPGLGHRSAGARRRITLRAARAGRSVEDFTERLERAQACAASVPRHLLALAEAFDRLGVTYGSHNDPDGDSRERFRMLGARVASFPHSAQAAAAAKAMDDPVIMSAADVVRGGPGSDGVSALALIACGHCDALASDDHYASLAAAAWVIADTGLRALPDAWAMISSTPARLAGLTDRGRLDPGQRADFVVVDKATRRIEATIAAGRVAHMSGALANRFVRGGTDLPLAAE